MAVIKKILTIAVLTAIVGCADSGGGVIEPHDKSGGSPILNRSMGAKAANPSAPKSPQ
ncbi:MAG TPA: hypothetical protein VG944_06920 [Fimbriimonas sp.]|nr:hypothetical protein [Fimbriimonas sp.]